MHASVVRLVLVFGALAAIVAALFAGALWLGRRWARRHPSANGAKRVITRTGFALYGCQTLLLFGGLSATQLQPDGPLGSFLRRPGGLPTYLVLLVVGFAIAEVLLAKLGHPTTRERERK